MSEQPGPPSDSLVGHVIGRYSVVQMLSDDGRITTYRAAHRLAPDVHRWLQVLHPQLTSDPSLRARFTSGAGRAMMIRHPNLHRALDLLDESGVLCSVWEEVPGRALLDVVRVTGVLEIPRVIQIVRQIADAVDHLHAQGIVHQEIKPGNVVIDVHDHATVVGLEMAVPTHAIDGGYVGNPSYIPPEVITGPSTADDSSDAVIPQVDRWALGVVTYELLTGRFPFDGSRRGLAYAIVSDEPEPPSRHRPELPAAIDAVVLRQLSKDPTRRFASCRAFATALGAAQSSGGSPTA